MLLKSFHWVLCAAQTPNVLVHQLFRRGGWLEDVTDVCRKELDSKERKTVSERGERHTSISSSLLTQPQAQLWSTCGEDGAGAAGGNMLNIALWSNYKTRLLNWGRLYPWIWLHGDCEWIILWSLIKESLNFEVGCSMCLHAKGVDTCSCLHD